MNDRPILSLQGDAFIEGFILNEYNCALVFFFFPFCKSTHFFHDKDRNTSETDTMTYGTEIQRINQFRYYIYKYYICQNDRLLFASFIRPA